MPIQTNNPIITRMTTGVKIRTEYFEGRARLIPCSFKKDERGILSPFYFDQMPFVPCRSFVITNVPAGTVRGGHAHRSGMQMLVCMHGSIEILMRYQDQEATLVLLPNSFNLVLGPGVWCRQKYMSGHSVLMVFASAPYDPDSYI